MPCSLFWPNDKKRETRSSCDTGITERKRSKGKQQEKMLE